MTMTEVPFGCPGTSRKVAHAPLLLISNESFYIDPHTPLTSATSSGSGAADICVF
jgi:hypothetical protein